MSISAALSSAASGLGVNSRLLGLASGNIANALTPGYAARSATLGNVSPEASGGVRVVSVDRAADPELTVLRRAADGSSARGAVLAEGLAELARAYGELGDPDGLVLRYQAFEQDLRALAETPESGSRQIAAAEAAEDLAGAFNAAASRAAEVRQSADAEIARQVGQVNSGLERIARLNRQIRIFESTGRESAHLVDERERLIDQVASAIPIRERRLDSGVVEIRTEQGLMLADAKARRLDFTQTPIITPGMSYADGTGALSGLSLGGLDITPGGPGTQRVNGGAFAGLFALRDEAAPAFQARIDSLAADLVERTSAAGVDPTLAPGAPGLFTDDGGPLDPSGISGLAGRIALNAAVNADGGTPSLLRDGLGATAPGPSSDDTILRSYLGALTTPRDASGTAGLAGPLDFRGRLAAAGELGSTARVSAEAEAAMLRSEREFLAAEEGARLGVDTDRELQDLILIERAYAANAQVVQTAARMLDELNGL